MMAFRLRNPGKAGTLDSEHIHIGSFTHDLFCYSFDVVAYQRRRAGGVDDHPLNLRHFVESLVHAFFQAFLAAKHNMSFLHIGRPHILHIEVSVICRITFSVPGVVGAADRAVYHLNGILQHAADYQLSAAKRTTPLGQCARDGRRIGYRQIFPSVFIGGF